MFEMELCEVMSSTSTNNESAVVHWPGPLMMQSVAHGDDINRRVMRCDIHFAIRAIFVEVVQVILYSKKT